MENKSDHISVCICTYKRPKLLENLLNKLENQQTNGLFIYSVVVVDNDYNQTARDTVESLKKSSRIAIDYHIEPEQNIALARNKAVDNAHGNFIAFIDDDEFPEPTWLVNLYKTLLSFKADGVLGPVRPHYPDHVPDWLIKSNLCERPEHETGAVLHWTQTRTGNVLLNKAMFADSGNRFGREFGRTGGEDIEFFKKMMGMGKVFIWCSTAPVFETVTPERCEKSFYLNKYLRIGGLTGEKHRTKLSGGFWYAAKIAMALFTYLFILPFSFIFGQHVFFRTLMKVVYFYGCIAGFSGYVPMRFR
ncbi:MAG: Hyaluronan synthase [Syntrophus sp. PtaB.Bin138]|nr:MAG: Hyaluronan synthase [Syntrophus sp. PtaB.Bin138]